MKSRIYCWPALVQLTLFLLLRFSADAQTVKVEGYGIYSNNYISQFDGHYFTFYRKDGLAVADLTGKITASGLKAAPQPLSIFKSFNLLMHSGVFFTDGGDGVVLKNVNGQALGTGKFFEAVPFVTYNTAVTVSLTRAGWIVAYIDTAGRDIVRFDMKKYMAITDPLGKAGQFLTTSISELLPFSEGLTPIRSRTSGNYGFINKKLELVIPVGYKNARPFSDGLAAVQNAEGNWGYINAAGKQVISYDYSMSPGRFMSGLAKVQSREGKFGYINKQGKVVIEPHYAYATTFYKGYALAKVGYNTPPLLIDSTGAVVTTFPQNTFYIDDSKPGAGISGGEALEYPFYTAETLRELVDEGEGVMIFGMLYYGVVDKTGRVVLDFKYKYLSDLHGGKLFGYKEKSGTTPYQIGIMSDKGEWVVNFVESQF